MTKLITLFNVFGSIFAIGSNANASLMFEQQEETTSSKSNRLILSEVPKKCDRLLELEYKNEILDTEVEEGQLLFDLIQQIDDNPIQYCDFSTATHRIDNNENAFF